MERLQHQIHTALFRENSTIKTAKARLKQTSGDRRLRILSFGCSIGEEIATLRFFFPDAELFGCEIYEPALAQAQRTVGHFGTVFRSSKAGIASHAPFDLIVASAVLCLNPVPKDFAERFPFSRFDEAVALLDSALGPNGILVLTNASYRFQDSTVWPKYTPIRSDIVTSAGFIDVFAKDGRPFLIAVPTAFAAVYRKGQAFAIQDDEELIDCVFEKNVGTQVMLSLSIRPDIDPIGEYIRHNTDALENGVPEDVVSIQTHVRFGLDRKTGRSGAFFQIGWPSLIREGRHERSPVWRDIS